MKFTKEDACKELAAKYKPRYGEPAIWERTINESVEHAMKLIGEESEIELDAFVGFVTPFLDTIGGFVKKETTTVAQGLNQQIEELKKQVGQKPEPNKNDGNEELLKRLEALENANKEAHLRDTVKTKRGEIVEKLKAKGVKDNNWIDLMLSKATIGEDTDTEKEAGEYLEIYNKMHASDGDGYTPLKPEGNPEGNRYSKVIEAAAKIAENRIA